MSNYTKSTNFATKDTLTSGDPNKVVKGTEIDAEYNAIQTAVNSKADLASPVFSGDPTAPTPATADNDSSLATTQFVRNLLNTMQAFIGMNNFNVFQVNKVLYYIEYAIGNSGTAFTLNWNNGANQSVTVNGNATITFSNVPGNPFNGKLKLVHDGTATAYTLTWPASVKWVGGTVPTLTNTASSVDIVSIYWDGSTVYWASMSKGFA